MSYIRRTPHSLCATMSMNSLKKSKISGKQNMPLTCTSRIKLGRVQDNLTAWEQVDF